MLSLACCLVLMTGCTPASEKPVQSAGSTQHRVFATPGLSAVLPSADTSTSMDALVSGIAARKEAEAAKARAIAAAKAKARAEALAKREAREAALASRSAGTRRYAAAKPGKHEPTMAEKAAAAKALALKRANKNMPVIVIFR